MRAIQENFRFLVLEVTKQIESTVEVIASGATELIDSVYLKDDYIDNLRGFIDSKCLAVIQGASKGDQRTVELARAVDIATNNLERIADFAVNILRQYKYIKDTSILQQYEFRPCFDEVLGALARVPEALFSADVAEALQICRSEFNLDEMYEGRFRNVMTELRAGGEQVEDLVTTLFIARYLERMGDSLLNIGEAILSLALHERLKIHQYWALEETLDVGASEGKGLSLESIAETRSGCRIGKVRDQREGGEGNLVLFKEGNLDKLLEEKAGIEFWQGRFPDLVPKVLGWQEGDHHASILLEYLRGQTFQQILLEGSAAELSAALSALGATLRSIWDATRIDEPVQPGFLKQIRKRLGDVKKVHPDFGDDQEQIGALKVPAFADLLRRAEAIEAELPAPFSVFIHGDFNVDNIIFDAEAGRLHFIDLHRSRRFDYVQDVSVFMVSNFRLPVFDAKMRRRLHRVILAVYRSVQGFAREVGDTTFEARLTLGMVRSFTTSTRFVLDEEFAQSMYLRARYLLERLLAHEGGEWSTFVLPANVLRY
ncbi:MAG: phosphotransferase [Myxococcales bacterium]|nr:phosphotransferase [Myxococcales bacterium]MCB9705062.1 phosphotransferase [Myxococcales bacterium]